MTKVALWNLPAETSEAELREVVEHYAPVVSVSIERQGDPQRPMAIVSLGLDGSAALRIVHRLDGLWHAGRFLSANVLMHP